MKEIAIVVSGGNYCESLTKKLGDSGETRFKVYSDNIKELIQAIMDDEILGIIGIGLDAYGSIRYYLKTSSEFSVESTKAFVFPRIVWIKFYNDSSDYNEVLWVGREMIDNY